MAEGPGRLCFHRGAKGVCTGCREVAFCSPVCRRAGWRAHKAGAAAAPGLPPMPAEPSATSTAPRTQEEATLSEAARKLAAIRSKIDDVATRHCLAQGGQGPAPDMGIVRGFIDEVEALMGELADAQRVQADMIVGCGWHLLHEPDKALKPLLKVVDAPAGAIALSDHLSAVMVAMPILRRLRMWAMVVKVGDKARELGSGVWADSTLPYVKGVALNNLNRAAQAAAALEEAIEMNPGFYQAYVEFDKACTVLRDFERCRAMAQKLVDHGGHWVHPMQRPDHFLRDPALACRPWHDAGGFELARKLEESFVVIRGELERCAAWGTVGSGDRGNENSAHDADLVTSGRWSEIVLMGDAAKCAANRERCPETVRVLESCPEAAECASLQLGETLFSQLQPGTRLRPHCGPTNMRLTCHLGLDVPPGCTITCGGETRTWEEGRCLVFDDSFEHEVQHDGERPRTVLLVNFWHPGIARERWPQLMQELRGPAPAAGAGP